MWLQKADCSYNVATFVATGSISICIIRRFIMKRRRVIRFRATDDDYLFIKRNAKMLKIGMSEYILRCIYGSKEEKPAERLPVSSAVREAQEVMERIKAGRV
jgi:uncharacterized protein (DUF1778 family)